MAEYDVIRKRGFYEGLRRQAKPKIVNRGEHKLQPLMQETIKESIGAYTFIKS